jgi:hypothetical protein
MKILLNKPIFSKLRACAEITAMKRCEHTIIAVSDSSQAGRDTTQQTRKQEITPCLKVNIQNLFKDTVSETD